MDPFLPLTYALHFPPSRPRRGAAFPRQVRGRAHQTERRGHRPKVAHQAESRPAPTHGDVPDWTPLIPPQRSGGMERLSRVGACAHACFCVCVYVCARVRVRAGAPCDPVESIRYFFFPSYNSVNSLLLAASKQTGKTKPRRFLIYHLAQSSMFHQPP